MGAALTRPKVVVRYDGQAGPIVALVGGIHGDEFYGPAAILAIAKRLKAVEVRGEVILVAAANPFAVVERARSSAQVPGNLNRQFGSNPKAAHPALYAMAQWLWTTHFSRAAVLVDIHSGGHQRMLPHARFTGNSEEILPMVRAMGIEHAMKYGSLPPGLLISRGRCNGSMALGLEVGGGLELNPQLLRKLSDGLWNLLIHLRVVDGAERKLRMPRLVTPGKKLRASAPGVFIPRVSVGDKLRKGDVVGEFTLFSSSKSRPVRALNDGTVFTLLTGGPAAKGETVVEIVS
jgi:predicted deacylase